MRHIYKGRLRQAYSYVIPVVATLLVCVGFCIIALSIAKREDAKMQDRTAAYVAHNLDTQFKNIKTYSNEVLNSKDMFSLSQAYISGAGDEQEIQIETNLMSNIYRYCSSMDLAENILLYYPKRDRIISKYGSLTTRQFFVLNNEEMLLSPELLQARIDDVFDRRHGEVYSVENSCSGITEYYYFACVPNNSTLDSCEWAMALQISPTALSKLLSEMTQTMNIAFAAITTQDGHIFSHTDMEQDAVSLRHKQVWPQDRDKSAMTRYESLTKMDLYLLFDTSASYHLLRSLSLIMSGGLILAALMGLVLALISQGMREQRVEKLVRRLGGEKGTTLNDAVEGFLARAYQENLQNVRALDHQRALVRYSFLKELLRASRLDEGRLDLLCTAYDMSFEGDGFSLFCLQQEGEGGERSKDAVFDFLTERGYSEYVVFWTRMENIDCFLCNYTADKNGRQMMEQFKAELNTTFHTHCYGTAAPSDSVYACIREFRQIYQVINGRPFAAYGTGGGRSRDDLYSQFAAAIANGEIEHQQILLQQICRRLRQEESSNYNLSMRYALLYELYGLPQLAGMEHTLDEMFRDMRPETWCSCLEKLLRAPNDAKSAERGQKRLAGEVVEIISKEYDNPQMSLMILSERLGASQSYLCRVFKQEYGESISHYLSKTRVEQAKILIRNGDEKLSSIALKVGFLSDMNLIRVFKKLENETPGNYRKKNPEKGAAT